MGIAEQIVTELQAEAPVTRKLMECIPAEKLSFKAHPKSMSIIEVASHMAETFTWTDAMVNMDSFEMDPTQYKPWVAASIDELLTTYDRNVAAAVDTIKSVSDEKMMVTWTMSVAGNPMLSLPRAAVLKSFLINHTIHHRGQLDVYLRLCDVPLPQIYGPTADNPC